MDLEALPPDIAELPFRDLYLTNDPDRLPRFNPTRSLALRHLPRNCAVPKQMMPAMRTLYEQVHSAEPTQRNFAIQLPTMRVRVVRTTDASGFHQYCLRKLPNDIPAFETLNYQPDFIEETLSWTEREGLILIMGPTGSGKTTLIMSLLELWCDDPGGVTVTIEDPVEFRLPKEGHNFTCIQWEAKTNEDWPMFVADSLRFAPSTILCGEIRTPETAAAVLSAAASGHKVLASVHGGTVQAGLQRLLSYASDSAMGASAADVLAEVLVAAAWQQIREGKPHVEFLPTARDGTTDPVRQYIRTNNLKMIPNQMEMLKAKRLTAAIKPQLVRR